jgi:hypothetical protein
MTAADGLSVGQRSPVAVRTRPVRTRAGRSSAATARAKPAAAALS